MNQNKLDSMDAVGELPDLGNLLLREGGFPHLANTIAVLVVENMALKKQHEELGK